MASYLHRFNLYLSVCAGITATAAVRLGYSVRIGRAFMEQCFSKFVCAIFHVIILLYFKKLCAVSRTRICLLLGLIKLKNLSIASMPEMFNRLLSQDGRLISEGQYFALICKNENFNLCVLSTIYGPENRQVHMVTRFKLQSARRGLC